MNKSEYKAFDNYAQELSRLQIENQQLKVENEKFQSHFKQIDDTNKILYSEKCELIKENQKLKAENEKYKTALDEIEEIRKRLMNECFYEDFECKGCDMTYHCNFYIKNEIRNIIKQAKEGE